MYMVKVFSTVCMTNLGKYDAPKAVTNEHDRPLAQLQHNLVSGRDEKEWHEVLQKDVFQVLTPSESLAMMISSKKWRR